MLLTSCFVYSKKKAIEAEHVAELARRAAEQEEAQKTAALARAKARATDAEWRASIARRRHVKFAEASTKLEVSVFFSITVCPYDKFMFFSGSVTFRIAKSIRGTGGG